MPFWVDGRVHNKIFFKVFAFDGSFDPLLLHHEQGRIGVITFILQVGKLRLWEAKWLTQTHLPTSQASSLSIHPMSCALVWVQESNETAERETMSLFLAFKFPKRESKPQVMD